MQNVYLPEESKGQATEPRIETKAYGFTHEIEKPFRRCTCLLFVWLGGCLCGWSNPVGAYSAGPPSSSSLSSVARFRIPPTSTSKAGEATRGRCFPTSQQLSADLVSGTKRSSGKFSPVSSYILSHPAGSAQLPRRQNQQLAKDHVRQVATSTCSSECQRTARHLKYLATLLLGGRANCSRVCVLAKLANSALTDSLWRKPFGALTFFQLATLRNCLRN